MGKFDGILICSDWDGTLFCNGEVPAESVEAIRYFQSEGGLFTICSGRQPEFLKQYENFVSPNTYALCYNGALICDLESGEILSEGFVDEDIFDIIEVLLEKCEGIRMINVAERGKGSHTHYTPAEYYSKRSAIRSCCAYKVTVSAESEAAALKMIQTVKSLETEKYIAVRSYTTYMEVFRKDYSKGVAAKLLKQHLGAKLLVCMGDFENDIPMFESADISYAVGNAVDQLKAIADRITVSVYESAVARVIEDLKRELAEKQ